MFAVGDLILRWDARKEEKGKHGKFENLWIGPFSIIKILGNNTFVLQNVCTLFINITRAHLSLEVLSLRLFGLFTLRSLIVMCFYF